MVFFKTSPQGGRVDYLTVRCTQCGSESRLIATEGELFVRDPKSERQITQIIDCTRCGRREQPEGSQRTAIGRNEWR